jgi:hypothetical protein
MKRRVSTKRIYKEEATLLRPIERLTRAREISLTISKDLEKWSHSSFFAYQDHYSSAFDTQKNNTVLVSSQRIIGVAWDVDF